MEVIRDRRGRILQVVYSPTHSRTLIHMAKPRPCTLYNSDGAILSTHRLDEDEKLPFFTKDWQLRLLDRRQAAAWVRHFRKTVRSI